MMAVWAAAETDPLGPVTGTHGIEDKRRLFYYRLYIDNLTCYTLCICLLYKGFYLIVAPSAINKTAYHVFH